jgi:hypothetical protein
VLKYKSPLQTRTQIDKMEDTMSHDIVQSTSSVTRGLSDDHKQIPRELIAAVELRLASSPEFESQLRNFLLDCSVQALNNGKELCEVDCQTAS